MRRLAVIVPVLALLALAGCAGAPTETATPAPTVSAAETPKPETTDLIDQAALESAFVETVRAELGDAVAGESDEGIVGLAWSVCRSLDAGVGPGAIADTFASNGIDVDVASNMIIGSATMLCSDHASKVLNGW